MKFFRTRADTQENTENSKTTEEEGILRSFLNNDENLSFEEAMKIPTFSACVNLISNTVSMIPFKIYEKKDGDVVEIENDRRVRLLNVDTGDTLDSVQFKRTMVHDYFGGKGAYAYINKNGLEVESIHYVDEREISFQYNTDPIFKDYDIIVNGTHHKPYEFIKVLRNTKNGRMGVSVVAENIKILSVAYASLNYEKNLVETGGNKKGFVKSAKKLTDEALKTLKAAWRKLYQNNTENVIVLNDGLDFKESSNTSVEMQLNENKKTNSDEICKIFNMPPEMLNGKATQDVVTNYIQYCVMPVLDAMKNALNKDLLLEKEKESYFYAPDVSELTKGDIEKRYKAYETAVKNSWMQPDEVRERENLKPYGLGFIKMGLQDVLYNPDTKEFYVPNMNSKGQFGKGGEDNAN